MPNWCSSVVRVTGDERELARFVTRGQDGGEVFSFESFFPTPRELAERKAPERNEKKAEELIKKYGAPDWYDWNLRAEGKHGRENDWKDVGVD